MRRLIVFLVLIFSLFSSPALGESIQLHYAWPPDLNFRINYSMVEGTRQGRNKMEMRVNGTSNISTRKHPGGLQVDYTDGKVSADILGMSHAPFEKKLQEFFLKLGEIDSGYVIGPEGGLLDVINFKELQSSIKKGINNLLADIPPSSQKIRARRLMESAVTREQLMSQFQGEWDRDIRQWHNKEMKFREVYEREGSQQVPMFETVQIPMKEKYTLVEQVPCSDSDNGASCVEIHMESEADEAGLEKLLREIDKEFERKSHAPRQLRINTTMTLITEPKTLLPHKMILNSRALLIHADGITIEKTRKHVETFEYPGTPN